MLGSCPASFLLAVVAFTGAGAQAPIHFDARPYFQHRHVTNAVIDARLERIAEAVDPGEADRSAVSDIALPADSSEYRALRGYALLVVTAVTHDSTELPLARAYSSGVHGTLEALPLHRVLTRVSSTTAVGRALGTYREDAVYLLSPDARDAGNDLLVDFACHRKGFRLLQFDGTEPMAKRALEDEPAPAGLPDGEAVRRLLAREYPDLNAALSRP